MEALHTLSSAGSPSRASAEGEMRELMVRYQGGDQAALEQLVADLAPLLLRFLGGPQVPREDTEDLYQECWMRIHRSRHTYRRSEPLLPWIYAIARHTRLDGLRRRQRRARHEVFMAEGPERVAPQEQSEGKQPNVLALLDRLPPSQREVVLLLKVSGMSLEEVARATGCSVGAIKQKAHRAYATLRGLLQEGA